MPQWQGGNNPIYHLGARLLYWLAPRGDAEFAEVPVAIPDGKQLPLEGGVIAKTAILAQNEAALSIIRTAQPDRIVTFGGDCSVSLAPFSYLASRYAGDVAVLWVDAHFDLTTSEVSSHAHGYPMLNLLGKGDAEFAAFAKKTRFPQNGSLTSASTKAQSPSVAAAPSKNLNPPCLRRPN